MVKNGQFMGARHTKKEGRSAPLERARYTPPATYGLDIELFSVSDLKNRVKENRFRKAHQINFYLLLLVTKGRCRPVVDYTPLTCTKGSLLLVRPNQALEFDLSDGWDGWTAIFRPEYLASAADNSGEKNFQLDDVHEVQSFTNLNEIQYKIISATLVQMAQDTQSDKHRLLLNAMLRFQLKSLLLRVLLSNNRTIDTEFDSTQISRFRRFKNLVEEKFCIQHKVADYANQLGCTVKSLSRATQASAAIGAKQYIAARIILEAKRLLTHTQTPISVIADQLGFDEPTNFVKFFKREGSLAPNEFRKQNYSIYN